MNGLIGVIMKRLLVALGMMLSFAVVAEDEKPKPLDPGYEGIHGMVLVSKSSTLYAYHMPLYQKPHDAQILYKVNSKMAPVTYLVKDADLVTIKPKKFNLQRLIRGESMTIIADVYMGHFERGGMLTYEGVEFSFDKQMYVRMLKDLPESGKRQKYDSVPVGKNERILVHQINKAPSYDHLILFYQNLNCMTDILTSSAVPAQGELINKLSLCGSMKPLYYETQDFQGAKGH